jgi:ABC-type branched-subunit amino acid transport system ATPase component
MMTSAAPARNGQAVIAVEGLRKSYGKLTAVKNVDLEIRRGATSGIWYAA